MKRKDETSVSFDEICEIEDRVASYNWKPDDVFYCIDDIKKHIEPDIKSNLSFAIWLLQKPPETNQEKEARCYLLNVVNDYIEGVNKN